MKRPASAAERWPIVPPPLEERLARCLDEISALVAVSRDEPDGTSISLVLAEIAAGSALENLRQYLRREEGGQ